MNVHEYQAKQLLREYGIEVPPGRLATTPDEAKSAAKDEGAREKAAAKAEIGQELQRACEMLREQVAALAVAGAEKILRREVDARAHAELLDGIKRQL